MMYLAGSACVIVSGVIHHDMWVLTAGCLFFVGTAINLVITGLSAIKAAIKACCK